MEKTRPDEMEVAKKENEKGKKKEKQGLNRKLLEIRFLNPYVFSLRSKT